MSKYEQLWNYVGAQTAASFRLTFDEIRQIAGLEIDHSFLNYQK